MRDIIRNKHFYYMLMGDLCLVSACFYLSYFIRFDFAIPGNELKGFFRVLPFGWRSEVAPVKCAPLS